MKSFLCAAIALATLTPASAQMYAKERPCPDEPTYFDSMLEITEGYIDEWESRCGRVPSARDKTIGALRDCWAEGENFGDSFYAFDRHSDGTLRINLGDGWFTANPCSWSRLDLERLEAPTPAKRPVE